MSHELELNENGEARMFYAGELPWHKLGTKVEKEVTAEAAIKLAGLDWVVEKRDIFTQGNVCIDDIPVVGQKIGTHKAIVRTEDESILGVVGNSYEPIQNSEAFGFLDALVGEGLAMFHTAGSLFDGKRIFITCKLPNSIQVGPDQVDKYLALATSHDGSLSLHIKWTPIRVVCWNTMSAAFNIFGGKVHAQDVVSVRHTANYKDNIQEARRLLNLTDVYYQRVEACFNQLIKTPISDTGFQQFTDKLYEPTIEDENGNKTASKYCEKKREQARELFHLGIGNNVQDVKGTRWAALNAITEQVDHHRNYYTSTYGGNENDAKMNSVIWGSGATTKKRALELLTA